MTIPITDSTTQIMFQWDNLPDYTKEQILVLQKLSSLEVIQINMGVDLSTYKNRYGLYLAPPQLLVLEGGQYTYIVINSGDAVPTLIEEDYTNTPLTKGLLIKEASATETPEFNSNTTYIEYEG